MKIAYISSGFLADCDLPLLEAMLAMGEDIVYFMFVSDSSKQATLINIKHLQPEGALYPATSYPELKHLEKYLPLNRIYVVNLPVPHGWAWSSIKAVLALYHFISNSNFDLIHLTWPPTYGEFPLYLLRNKTILTMHDPIPHSSNMGFLNRFHRWVAFKLINNFIVLSKSLRENFINTYKLKNKNVFTSCLGPYNVLRNIKQTEIECPLKYILFIGSINPHKGIRYLCEAMRIVHGQIPDLQLVIAGRGKFDFNIEEYKETGYISVINRFIFDSELVTLINNSKFVVCPYIDATQSGVIMSAFALKKPVIATNVGALPEMLKDNRHGKLVPPKDEKSLADAITNMCDEDLLNNMKTNIQTDYEFGKKSWAHIANETINIYKKIIK